MKLLLACLLVCLAISSKYDYADQQNWPGVCKTGLKQSPVNIIESQVQPCQPNFQFNIYLFSKFYKPIIQAPQDQKTKFQNSILSIRRNSTLNHYIAKQFHFHRASQHRLNNVTHDLEMHIVHQNEADGSLAVYAILFRVQNHHVQDPFRRWFYGDQYGTLFPIDLDSHQQVYYYQGSLTTPSNPKPCMEGVQWFVNANVIPISQFSYIRIANLIYGNDETGNNRNVQDLNGRKIYQSGSVCQNRPSFNRHMLRSVNQ